ncbi:MAG: hypothetical protein WD470_07890 [Rhodospirillaceae bacterium]
MSDSVKSTPAAQPAAAKPEPKSEPKSAPAATKAADTAAAGSGDGGASAAGDGAKSGRAAMGGAAVGHYGFFSNIKSPEYKSGWDDIWGKKETSKSRGARKAASKEPVTVAIELADLPPAARRALAEAAKARLGRGKSAYDRADKAATLSWTIEVTVPR